MRLEGRMSGGRCYVVTERTPQAGGSWVSERLGQEGPFYGLPQGLGM